MEGREGEWMVDSSNVICGADVFWEWGCGLWCARRGPRRDAIPSELR